MRCSLRLSMFIELLRVPTNSHAPSLQVLVPLFTVRTYEGPEAETLRGLKRVDRFKRREAYWTLETHMVLLEYLDRRQELTNGDQLFINVQDRRRLSSRSIQRCLKEYLRQTKVDPSGISPHSFRHSVGKRAAASQMYTPLLQSLLGHRNPNSSQVYYNIQNEALRREYHTKLGDLRTEKVLQALKNKPVPKRHSDVL
jgi:integrase